MFVTSLSKIQPNFDDDHKMLTIDLITNTVRNISIDYVKTTDQYTFPLHLPIISVLTSDITLWVTIISHQLSSRFYFPVYFP